MEPEHIGLYQALREQDALTVRVQAVPELENNALVTDEPKSLDEVRETLAAALEMRSRNDGWLRVDGVTTTVYGPYYVGVGPWPTPYDDPFGGRTTGQRVLSEEKTELAFEFCAQHGLRLNLCCVSPVEHEEYLSATEAMCAKHGLDRTGWVVQHGYLMTQDQARRYAGLGFDMTISMSFTFGKGCMLAERVGPEAVELLNPLRHLLDSGMAVAASTDWGPKNPFELMQLAVTHRMFPCGDSNAGPAQVVSRREAFSMWTSQASRVLRWDGIGALATGAHADLAILDRNPVECDLDALPDTSVLRTVVAGRTVHDSGALGGEG